MQLSTSQFKDTAAFFFHTHLSEASQCPGPHLPLGRLRKIDLTERPVKEMFDQKVKKVWDTILLRAQELEVVPQSLQTKELERISPIKAMSLMSMQWLSINPKQNL